VAVWAVNATFACFKMEVAHRPSSGLPTTVLLLLLLLDALLSPLGPTRSVVVAEDAAIVVIAV
jgi:hypothetical protein